MNGYGCPDMELRISPYLLARAVIIPWAEVPAA